MKGRQRGRNGGGGGGGGGGGKPRPPGRNPNFDGGNNRPRGNAQQLMEKYLALARDASSAGDRVLAENYLQHADHYYRVLNARFEQNGQPRRDGPGQGQGQPQGGQPYGGGYNDRPYDEQPQHNPQGGYGGQPQHQQHQQPQPQQQHQQPQHHQPHHQHQDAAPDQHQGNEAEIALPPGILAEAPPLETGGEPQDAGDSQEAGGESNRNRGERGRGRRRGRGDRPFANASE